MNGPCNDCNSIIQVTHRKLPPPLRAHAGHNDRVFLKVSPIHKAAALGEVQVIYDLYEKCGKSILDSLNDAGTTPLCAAILENQVEVVNLLLQLGCDVNKIGSDGKTPLQTAAECGHRDDIIRILIEHGCDTDMSTDSFYRLHPSTRAYFR